MPEVLYLARDIVAAVLWKCIGLRQWLPPSSCRPGERGTRHAFLGGRIEHLRQRSLLPSHMRECVSVDKQVSRWYTYVCYRMLPCLKHLNELLM